MWNHDEMPLLPATGQVTSYRAGDDGALRFGRPGGNRFRDMGDGTVYDRFASLLWVKQPELIIPGAAGVHASNQVQAARGNWANATAYARADLAKDAADGTYWVCAVAHASAGAAASFAQDRAANPTYWRQSVWTASAANLTTPAKMGWNAAVDQCLALTHAGFTDWRLPNVNELAVLRDWSRTSGFGGFTAFPNGQPTYYWTSTTLPPSDGLEVNFSPTSGYLVVPDATTLLRYVRPVRAGRTNV
jgi:hypothetical protein